MSLRHPVQDVHRFTGTMITQNIPFSFEDPCGVNTILRRCDDNQQTTVAHFGENKRLHLESSKQTYYIISF